jgi:CRP-like cAMP-binding protein
VTAAPRVDASTSRARSSSTITPPMPGAASILEQPQPLLSSRQSWREVLLDKGAASNTDSSNKNLPTDDFETSSTSKDFPGKSAMLAPVRMSKELWASQFHSDKPLKEDHKIVIVTTTDSGEAKMPRGYFSPFGKFRRKWDQYILVLLFYVATISVFVHSFIQKIGMSSPWFWVERWLDVSFFIDVYLCFRTGYITRSGKLETRKRKVNLHYLRTWFAIDAVGTFPWDFLEYLISDSAHTGWLQLPRLLRLFRIFKGMKVFRILRLKQSVTRLEVRLRIKYGHLRLIWLLIIVVLIAHWCGCLFYLVGDVSGPREESWIGQEAVPSDIFGKYLTAVYFATFTITTIGYGDVVPHNALERTYVVFMMLVGALMFAFVISQVGDTVAELTAKRSKYRREMDELTEFVSAHGVPDGLAFDLRRYFQHRTTYQHAYQHQDMLDSMSVDLRAKVMAHLYEDRLKESVLLRNLSESKREDVYVSVKGGLARPGETLYMEGDPSYFMYSVLHGHMDVSDADNGVRRLGPGCVFGEEELLFNRRRRGTARAVGYCDYAKLSRDAVLTVLRRDRGVLRDLRHHEAGSIWVRALTHAEKDVRLWMIVHILRGIAHNQERYWRQLKLQEARTVMAREHEGHGLSPGNGLAGGDIPAIVALGSPAVDLPSGMVPDWAKGEIPAPAANSTGGGLDSESDGNMEPPRYCGSTGPFVVNGAAHARQDSAAAAAVVAATGISAATPSDRDWSSESSLESEVDEVFAHSRAMPSTDASRAVIRADTLSAHAMTREELEREYVTRGKHLLRLMARAQALASASAALHADVGECLPRGR